MGETFRGGARVGPNSWWGLGATWPLASLRIDTDRIILKIIGLAYIFEKANIKGLSKQKILWSAHLKIVHNDASNPRSISFVPLSFCAVEAALERYNYQVGAISQQTVEEISQIKFNNPIGILSVLAGVGGILAAIFVWYVSR